MNFFNRFTSVFLCCVLLSSFFVVPVSAVDDINYYSIPPVGDYESSASINWPVSPAVDGFTSTDSRNLANIWSYIQYFTFSPSSWGSNSLFGFLDKIYARLPSNLSTNFQLIGSGRGTNSILDEIAKWSMISYDYLSSDNIAGNLGNIQRNTAATADRVLDANSLLGSINTAVSGINGFATENTLDSLRSYFADIFSVDYIASGTSVYGARYKFKNSNGTDIFVSLPYLMWYLQTFLTFDADMSTNRPTIYRMLHLLQSTLASEDDRQLAENYKENREEAEKDFLSGQSGKTSLGKGDFSNASDVGGALSDTFNMGGTSKVSDFVSGFGSAGEESLSWFSNATANNLDGVTAAGNSTSGVSSFSDDGETMANVYPDPYNMAGIADRYDWLEGVLG